MEKEKIIVFYDSENVRGFINARKISENRFKLLENDEFEGELNLGAVIETRINENGEYVFVRVIEDSDFITRRFSLTIRFTESEYLLLGDEIVKHGGHWETTLFGIAIVNIPKNSYLYFDNIFKTFNLVPLEIKK